MSRAPANLRAGFLVAACLAAPLSAQLAPSRSGQSSSYSYGADVAMNDLAVFGRCFARREQKNALALLATDPSSRAEAETYTRLFRRDDQVCLGPGMSVSAPLAYDRGAVAEGFYHTGTQVPASHLLSAPAAAEVRNLAGAARCYAAGHRTEVQALLKTRPASPEERQAVEALYRDFTACLPEGVSIQFDATVIRYRLAEALIRLAPAMAG